MTEVITAASPTASGNPREARPGFEVRDQEFAAVLGPAPRLALVAETDAIWAAVLNPAVGAGQRHDQEPGRW